MPTLCIDIGNTRIKYALFTEGQLVEANTCNEHQLQKMLVDYPNDAPVICSTVRNDKAALVLELQKFKQHILLDHTVALPITLAYGTPQTLGRDRIALACAAAMKYPMQTTLVIGLGTCITYNVVHQNQFLGGAISPGLYMRLKAMHEYTQLLPLVDINTDVTVLAQSTEHNLQSGAYHGLLAELHGMIALYKAEHQQFNVVLTGGNMTQVAPRLNCKIFADENFLFSGLYSIAQYHFGAASMQQ